jgi:hypothetical protein
MLKKSAALLLLAFLASAPEARAETNDAMSDAALASYISGRLGTVLKGTGHTAAQNCNESGCAVVVQ